MSIEIQILGDVIVFLVSAALALRKEAWDQAPSAPLPPSTAEPGSYEEG